MQVRHVPAPHGVPDGGTWRRCRAAPGGMLYCMTAQQRRRSLQQQVQAYEEHTGFPLGELTSGQCPQAIEKAAWEAQAELDEAKAKGKRTWCCCAEPYRDLSLSAL